VREPIVTDDAIKGFFGPYRFLSNFHVANVVFEGQVFPSTENAFQAAKFPVLERAPFQRMTCREAKEAGRSAKIIREEWEARKIQVMHDILISKFFGHGDLGLRLLSTGTKKLCELNDWGDRFWGIEQVKESLIGHNMLGTLLMAVRSTLEVRQKFCEEATRLIKADALLFL
jgi:ribA/ribD-fused uncharacterized protein